MQRHADLAMHAGGKYLGDALTLDPHAQNEGPTSAMNAHVYEPLISRDPTLSKVPALALSWKIGDKRRVAFCLEGLATAAGTGQRLRAAQLFGAAAALRDAIGAPLPPSEQADYECNVAAARAHDADTFAAAWDAGSTMALEQTVAFALSL